MTNVRNFQLEAFGATRARLSCEHERHKYHLWLKRDSLKPISEVVYKNSLYDQAYRMRKLTRVKGQGKVVADQMFAALPGLQMLPDQSELADQARKASLARRQKIYALARQQWLDSGTLEIDDNAGVSGEQANGCYVQAWVWVDFTATELEKENAG